MYLSMHFGYPVQGIPRCVEHKLGGGDLMDLGVYGVSMALQVFNDEPERIVASADMQNGNFPKKNWRMERSQCPTELANDSDSLLLHFL